MNCGPAAGSWSSARASSVASSPPRCGGPRVPVTVVEPLAAPMVRVGGRAPSDARCERYHESKGVRIRCVPQRDPGARLGRGSRSRRCASSSTTAAGCPPTCSSRPSGRGRTPSGCVGNGLDLTDGVLAATTTCGWTAADRTWWPSVTSPGSPTRVRRRPAPRRALVHPDRHRQAGSRDPGRAALIDGAPEPSRVRPAPVVLERPARPAAAELRLAGARRRVADRRGRPRPAGPTDCSCDYHRDGPPGRRPAGQPPRPPARTTASHFAHSSPTA